MSQFGATLTLCVSAPSTSLKENLPLVANKVPGHGVPVFSVNEPVIWSPRPSEISGSSLVPTIVIVMSCVTLAPCLSSRVIV